MKFSKTLNFLPARSDARIIESISSIEIAGGFCRLTCLPASSESMTISWCRK